jgi:hypothetical protein
MDFEYCDFYKTDTMKPLKNFKFLLAALLVLPAAATSCSNMDSDFADFTLNPDALVTVKTTDDGQSYFQVDSLTTLEPTAWTNGYGKEVRALLKYSETSKKSDRFSRTVKVQWIDSVRTKSPVLYDEEFKKVEGASVTIYDDWLTVCEDGYLSLHIAAWWGRSRNIQHYIDLGVDPQTNDLYLRHNSNGDVTDLTIAESFVAFKLDDVLTDVKAGDLLTLHWQDYNGERTVKFKYSPRFTLPDSSK